jgi:hypothetical protein
VLVKFIYILIFYCFTIVGKDRLSFSFFGIFVVRLKCRCLFGCYWVPPLPYYEMDCCVVKSLDGNVAGVDGEGCVVFIFT